MDRINGRGIVILVVGDLQEEKASVVDRLTNGVRWDQQRTAAGVVTFINNFGDQVIDTTPLRNFQGRSPTAIARRWISRNSLRRVIFEKIVFAVCVVTCAVVKEQCNTVVFSNHTCWLDVLGLIFAQHKDIMVVVDTKGTDLSTKLKHQVSHCLLRHGFRKVLFSNLTTDHIMTALIEASVQKMCPNFYSLSNQMITLQRGDSTSYGTPFLMRKPSPALSGRERFGPWGPERVFLFGKTGSGKSTLAQMLTTGTVVPNATIFKASSSIRGGTREIERGEGRGWYVVDTPGFGEPESEPSTVATHVAQDMVKHFVEWKEGTFSHYLFVLKKDRIDDLEKKLWEFFKLLFGETINHHFSIVISNADNEWLEGNISYLQKAFGGCESFLTAEFPLTDGDEEDLENECQEMRTGSLRLLEDELARLGRADLVCKFGEHSKMHQLNEKHRPYIDSQVDRSTAFFVDIVDKLGFISSLTSVDEFLYRLSKAVKTDKIILNTI